MSQDNLAVFKADVRNDAAVAYMLDQMRKEVSHLNHTTLVNALTCVFKKLDDETFHYGSCLLGITTEHKSGWLRLAIHDRFREINGWRWVREPNRYEPGSNSHGNFVSAMVYKLNPSEQALLQKKPRVSQSDLIDKLIDYIRPIAEQLTGINNPLVHCCVGFPAALVGCEGWECHSVEPVSFRTSTVLQEYQSGLEIVLFGHSLKMTIMFNYHTLHKGVEVAKKHASVMAMFGTTTAQDQHAAAERKAQLDEMERKAREMREESGASSSHFHDRETENARRIMEIFSSGMLGSGMFGFNKRGI